jgi:ribonuclease HII
MVLPQHQYWQKHIEMIMDRIHEEFPMYNWKQNKGYPTNIER